MLIDAEILWPESHEKKHDTSYLRETALHFIPQENCMSPKLRTFDGNLRLWSFTCCMMQQTSSNRVLNTWIPGQTLKFLASVNSRWILRSIRRVGVLDLEQICVGRTNFLIALTDIKSCTSMRSGSQGGLGAIWKESGCLMSKQQPSHEDNDGF